MTGIAQQIVEATAIFLVAVTLYGLVLRRLADAVQPWRLRLATLGERLLAEDPSERRATDISFFLDNAFSGWVMTVAAFVLPFAAAWGVIKRSSSRGAPDRRSTGDDEKIALLFAASAFAANPFFGAIVALEAFVIGFVLLLASGTPALAASALDELLQVEIAVFGRRGRDPSATIAAG